MNYIIHTRASFAQLAAEPKATAFHISLYVVLFLRWNRAHFPDSIVMIRDELMSEAHIGSRSRYLACLHDLTAWGLITYLPSHSQHRPSRAMMHELTELCQNPDSAHDEFSTMPTNEHSCEHTPEHSRGKAVGKAEGPILKTSKHLTTEPNPINFSNHDAGTMPKNESRASAIRQLIEEPFANRASPRSSPKEKVAPKRKSPSDTSRPGPKPEILFSESELANPEAFAAAFAGTDFALANLLYYHEKVANWRKDGEPPRRRDWKSTSKNFMLNDIERNALVLAPTTRRSSNSPYSGQPGSVMPDTDAYVSQRYS